MGGQALGDAWLKLMTERDFIIKKTGRKVRWKVGQPLGLLSSFPSFALWHHDIIQFCANQERLQKGKPLKFFKDYRLLGDDVVIFDDKVADIYQEMLKRLGVHINLSKSVFGDNKKSQIEFAKRLALSGTEMSSLKYNILSKDSMQNMLELVDLMYNRGIISPESDHFDSFKFLSSVECEHLNFIFWARSRSDAPFKLDNTSSEISRASYNEALIELRSQNLKKKVTDSCMKIGQKELNDLYKAAGIPQNAAAMGMVRCKYITGNPELHPLVRAIDQTNIDLNDTLSTLLAEPDLEVTPVEYLPVVSRKAYFERPKAGRSLYLSQLILDVFQTLKDETSNTSWYS